jgi:hypothetical protein
MNPYLDKPFTNDLGQVIQPGDKVIAIASGYCHRTNVYEGVLLGVRQSTGYSGEERFTPVCRVKRSVGWGKNKTYVERQTTLPLGRVYAIK